jgi:hypothetical protein
LGSRTPRPTFARSEAIVHDSRDYLRGRPRASRIGDTRWRTHVGGAIVYLPTHIASRFYARPPAIDVAIPLSVAWIQDRQSSLRSFGDDNLPLSKRDHLLYDIARNLDTEQFRRRQGLALRSVLAISSQATV